MPSILKLGNTTGSGMGGSFQDQYSVLLDGTDEYINIDAVQTALATTTVGTISLWVKPVDATPTTAGTIVGFGDTNANSDIFIFINTDGTLDLLMREAGVIKCRVATDAAAFSDNTWGHLAIVQDGVSPVIYIDGTAVSQTFSVATDKTIWFNDIAGLDNGRIGCRNQNSGGNTLFFNSNFNDVLFINDALTSGEITTLYNSGTPKDERSIPNGVSYFKIDGDVVNTCTDSIGTNHGTYVNVEQADIELDTP